MINGGRIQQAPLDQVEEALSEHAPVRSMKPSGSKADSLQAPQSQFMARPEAEAAMDTYVAEPKLKNKSLSEPSDYPFREVEALLAKGQVEEAGTLIKSILAAHPELESELTLELKDLIKKSDED